MDVTPHKETTVLTLAGVSLVLALCLLSAPGVGAQPPRPRAQPPPAVAPGADRIPYVDTHAHLVALTGGSCDFDFALADALAVMDRLGMGMSIVMPPPSPTQGCDAEGLAPLASLYPERVAFLAGGRSLNPLIQQAVRAGQVDDGLLAAFEQRAIEIIQQGAAGFGEMTALHVSFGPTHPYEAAPADHPLFLLLADIAASLDVPIDLHMEAVPEDMPFSNAQLTQFMGRPVSTPNNPDRLTEDMAAFERLLDHNPDARIVWAHVGADPLEARTAELTARLLEVHPNLYLQLRVLPPRESPTVLLARSATGAAIRPEWLELIRAFPTRMVLGSDRFYRAAGTGQPFLPGPEEQQRADELYRAFLDPLPPDLARQIGYENAVRIYRLGPRSTGEDVPSADESGEQ